MKTFKVHGELRDGRSYQFLVKSEDSAIARSVIVEKLVGLKLPPETLFVSEATEVEVEKAPRIITIKSAEAEAKVTDVFKTNSDQFKIIKVGA